MLTVAYHDIYGADGEEGQDTQLQLITAPLASTEEVVNLYTAGLCPVEIAVPACLHAIGASRDEIAAAVDKLSKQAEAQTAGEDAERGRADADHKAGLREKDQAGKQSKEDHALSLEERRQVMEIAKEAAAMQLKKDEHEMKIAEKLANKPAASSGSGSGSKK